MGPEAPTPDPCFLSRVMPPTQPPGPDAHTLVQPGLRLCWPPTADSCPLLPGRHGRRALRPGQQQRLARRARARAGVGEGEAGTDVARTSEDGASSELGKEDEEGRPTGRPGCARTCGGDASEAAGHGTASTSTGIMMAILVNTVSMGIEHTGQASAGSGARGGMGRAGTCVPGAWRHPLCVCLVLGPIQPCDSVPSPGLGHGGGRAQGWMSDPMATWG